MSKATYSVIGGVNRKNKKGYAVVGGVNRKVKKAYSIIGGVARPCWSGGEVTYYGTLTPFTTAGNEMASGTVGNYALFAGGYGRNLAVDVYSNQLVHSTATNLSSNRASTTGESVGNYFLVAGGYSGGKSFNTVEAFNSNLSKSAATSLVSKAHYLFHGNTGNHAIFAGGCYPSVATSGYTLIKTANAYDSNLTRTEISAMSVARCLGASTTVGNKAFFAGGFTAYEKTTSAVVEVYNSDLTVTTAPSLRTGLVWNTAVKCGNHAVVAGGEDANEVVYAQADAYDSNLTKTVLTDLSVARKGSMGTHLSNFGIVAGGKASKVTTATDIYDASLVHTTSAITTARYKGGAATIGNYALIASGNDNSTYNATVEAFTFV
jgi:hypothetical protein